MDGWIRMAWNWIYGLWLDILNGIDEKMDWNEW